ncbi:retroviral-like aspartic protease family protein [Sphingomonas sp. LT1P40]|uniref:retroviral-like aspartic protease family protein n=1 Tax=Alteristakelama amylovorans TaxID=3096166 RepID=UPI002FC83467
MRRIIRGMQSRLSLLLIAFIAAPAATQETAPAPAIGEDASGTLALGALANRMTVPVSINGSAPHPFVIDTGAERSVISRQLAATLGLSAGPQITLTTMTGSSKVPTVRIPSLTVGPVRDQRAFNAPALEAAHMGAHGLLGIEQLRTHMVAIDFDRGEMALRPSRRSGVRMMAPRDRDEVVITAKSLFGQLIVTEATFEGARITVILDTGSQISMGNLALQRRLRRIPMKGPITLTSVTGEQLTVNYHVASRVQLGGISMRGLPVAFADIPPFERFGLIERPALMLGMDALRAFRRVEIDFPDRKVRFLLPRG